MTPLQIPYLPTLDTPPSWHNANGRVDRSACFEVSIGQVRRLAECIRYRPKPKRRGRQKFERLSPQPLPNERRSINIHGRVATGTYTITADDLLALTRRKKPRVLNGDWRGYRAPAMRTCRFDPDQPIRIRAGRHDVTVILPFDAGLDANPNNGAASEKKLGIWSNWHQPLRIEKWRFPTRTQPGYYLVCPGHATPNDHRARGDDSIDPRLPPVSTRPLGREDPKSGQCPQRIYKLMMPMCTQAEFEDACRAQYWIASVPMSIRAKVQPEINTLIERYGLLFQPRTLLCFRCLGVRYGNNPETARQSWRRLAGKPDARPAKRKVTRSNNWKWAKQSKRETRRRKR